MAQEERYVIWPMAALLDPGNKLQYRLQVDALRRRAPQLDDGFQDDPLLKRFQAAALTLGCAMPSREKWFDAPLLAEFETKQRKAIDLDARPSLASILMRQYLKEAGAELTMPPTVPGGPDPHGLGLLIAARQERLGSLTISLLLWMQDPKMIHRCEWCSFTFTGRADARFCNSNCRTAASVARADRIHQAHLDAQADEEAAQEADDD